MFRTVGWIVYALALTLAGSSWAENAPTPARTEGIVSDGAIQKDVIWFSLNGDDIRYQAQTGDVPNSDAVFAALKSSSETERDLIVDYDIDSGDVDPDTGVATFVFRDVIFGDKQIPGAPAPSHRAGSATPGSLIARGIALAESRPEEAKRALDAALASSGLSPPLRETAFKTRSRVLTDLAVAWREPGVERDRLLVAALADVRAYRDLRPSNFDAALDEVDILNELGAYAAVLKMLETMRAKWPNEDYRISVKTAFTYRLMGDPNSALAALDAFVTRAGPPVGMKYHYHRAWILTDMGRGKEAADEITEGLKSQPDYSWAFQRRACAYALQGRLKEALDDQQTAMRLATTTPASSPSMRFNVAWMSKVADQLRAAVAAGSTAPVNSPCVGMWDDSDETRRSQSALLTE